MCLSINICFSNCSCFLIILDDIFRRKSFADSGASSHKLSADNINQAENEEVNIQQTKRLPYSEVRLFN